MCSVFPLLADSLRARRMPGAAIRFRTAFLAMATTYSSLLCASKNSSTAGLAKPPSKIDVCCIAFDDIDEGEVVFPGARISPLHDVAQAALAHHGAKVAGPIDIGPVVGDSILNRNQGWWNDLPDVKFAFPEHSQVE